MTQRRFVVADTGSGAGKTTITIGLMAAFRKKGYAVQGFKCSHGYTHLHFASNPDIGWIDKCLEVKARA